MSTGYYCGEVKVDQLVRHQSGLDAGLYGDGQHSLEQRDPQPLAKGVQRAVIRPRAKQAEPAEPALDNVLLYSVQQGMHLQARCIRPFAAHGHCRLRPGEKGSSTPRICQPGDQCVPHLAEDLPGQADLQSTMGAFAQFRQADSVVTST